MVRDEKANPDIGALPRVFDKTPGKYAGLSISCSKTCKAWRWEASKHTSASKDVEVHCMDNHAMHVNILARKCWLEPSQMDQHIQYYENAEMHVITNDFICRHGNNTERREQILQVASKLLADPQRGFTSRDEHVNFQPAKYNCNCCVRWIGRRGVCILCMCVCARARAHGVMCGLNLS